MATASNSPRMGSPPRTNCAREGSPDLSEPPRRLVDDEQAVVTGVRGGLVINGVVLPQQPPHHRDSSGFAQVQRVLTALPGRARVFIGDGVGPTVAPAPLSISLLAPLCGNGDGSGQPSGKARGVLWAPYIYARQSFKGGTVAGSDPRSPAAVTGSVAMNWAGR
jgi:hypothetical protein